MRKSLYYLILSVVAFAFWGCEEEDALLRFAEVNLSNSDNVELEYYSPDPLHMSKTYYVTANGEASELTIKCTNADAIAFRFHAGITNYERTKFICPDENWMAETVDKNMVKFTFYDVDDDIDLTVNSGETPSPNFSCVSVQTIGSIDIVSEGIYVRRYPSRNPVR